MRNKVFTKILTVLLSLPFLSSIAIQAQQVRDSTDLPIKKKFTGKLGD